MTAELLPEVALTALAGVLYAAAWCVDFAWLVRQSSRLRLLVTALVAAGLAVQSVAIAIRWQHTGHPPVMGTFENGMACAWFLALGTLALRRALEWRFAAQGTLLAGVIAIAWGLTHVTTRFPLTISERSLWVELHAGVAWLAFFAGTAAAWACALSVVRAWEARTGRAVRVARALPGRDWANEMAAQSLLYSFAGVSAVIATGAWYSWLLFGQTWRWDLVEVIALFTWLVLGLAIHARLFFGWRGFRLAILYLFAYLGMIWMYWLLVLTPFVTYHYFELPF